MEPGQASVVRGLPAQLRLSSPYMRAVQDLGIPAGCESRPIKTGIHMKRAAMFIAIFVFVFEAGTAQPILLPRAQTSQMNVSAPVIPDFGAESPADAAAYEEREFIQRLNGLSRALTDFAAR
jgi:hypothetical protein